jgi:hypothetical protein
MRNISLTIAQIANNSRILRQHLKADLIAFDTCHAKAFESAGSRAIYAVGNTATHLQFIGAHTGQVDLVEQMLSALESEHEVHLVTLTGSEVITADRALEEARRMRFHVRDNQVWSSTGECLAVDLQLKCKGSSVVASYEYGDGFVESLTNLAGLRQIALHEALALGDVSLKQILLGNRDITTPKHAPRLQLPAFSHRQH